MSVKQISVFIENKKGKLAEATRYIAEHDVNLKALSIADTQDFGILRIITDDSDKALSVLKDAKFTTKTTDVLAISISDQVGALHDVMALFQNNGINIEYLYASLEKTGDTAIIIFKVQDADKGLKVIEENGLSTVGKF